MKTGATEKDPFRKRSFDPARDVALMLHAFEQEHQGSTTAWHLNLWLRHCLTEHGYAKKIARLEKLFPVKAAR